MCGRWGNRTPAGRLLTKNMNVYQKCPAPRLPLGFVPRKKPIYALERVPYHISVGREVYLRFVAQLLQVLIGYPEILHGLLLT